MEYRHSFGVNGLLPSQLSGFSRTAIYLGRTGAGSHFSLSHVCHVVFAIIYKKLITARVGIALCLSYAGTLMVFIEQVTIASSGLVLGSGLVLTGVYVVSRVKS